MSSKQVFATLPGILCLFSLISFFHLIKNLKLDRRVVFGSIIPGFDDNTLDWESCTPRPMEMSSVLVEGACGYLVDAKMTDTIAIAWDDLTEVCSSPPLLLTPI